MLAWMLYASATAVLIGVIAASVEHIAIARQRSARFVWMVAIVATAVLPIVAYVRAPVAVSAVQPQNTDGVTVGSPVTIAPSTSFINLAFEVDGLLAGAWIVASLILAARLAYAIYVVRTRTRHLPTKTVDGIRVRESVDFGPAVIGIAPMEVVIPAWIRDLDEPLRHLVLLHEDEHRSARDPHTLFAGAVLAVLMPWNIGLLWQLRRLRVAVELDCDARVLRVHPDRERYGLLLLAIAQRRNTGLLLAATSMSEPASNLARRIAAMKTASTKISRTRVASVALVAAAAVAVACSVDAPTKPAAEPPSDLSVTVTPLKLNYASMTATMDSVLEFYNTALKRLGSQSAEYDSVRVLLSRVEEALGGAQAQGALQMKLAPTTKTVEAQMQQQLQRMKVEQAATRADTVLETRALPRKVAASETLTEAQVEGEASLRQGTMNPAYPPTLKSAGIEGEVIAEFVVGADGKVDLGTFRVQQSSHALFTAAVREALAHAEFKPAVVGGRAVRQLLKLPFGFSVK